MSNDSLNPKKQQEILLLKKRVNEEIAGQLEVFFESILEHSYKHSGAGSYFSQFSKALSEIDRFGIRTVTQNNEHSGLTFITRPKLNFMSGNLAHNRLLSILNNTDPLSIQFMIRSLLDTKFCNNPAVMELVYRSPLINHESPFITPLTNCLESISGFPSYNLETYTTEGGFYSEDLSFPIGSDRNRKSFDLQLAFVDIQGGICAAILQMWMEYIAAIVVGEMRQYTEDIDAQRMGFTCSIYRFLLDPSKRYITRWCKCTGGFPIARPSGAVFDLNQSEVFVEAAKKFSVTFKFNHMGIDSDPIILKEFNMLMERFCPDIKRSNNMDVVSTDAHNNYIGLPYITMSQYGPQLEFRARPLTNRDTVYEELEELSNNVTISQQQLQNDIQEILNAPEPESTVTYL